jgi:hypothetical protein
MPREDLEQGWLSPSYPTERPLWIVVRRAELSFDTAAGHALMCVGSVLYQGLDRLEWWDLDELYWSRRLPAELVAPYEALLATAQPRRLMGAERWAEAARLLRATEVVAARNEVVCVVGAGHLPDGLCPAVEWLGYDPIYKSGTSCTLLAEVYGAPGGPLAEAARDLNEFGLFPTAGQAAEFAERYRLLALEDKAEPLPSFEESTEVLVVGRPLERDGAPG